MSEPADSNPGWRRLPALRHRNFRLFITGQIISLIGTWMQTTALQWVVWNMGRDELQVGMLTFASQIPNLLFAPVAGVFADRYPKHRLVVLTQFLAMSQAFMLAALTWTNHAQFAPIVALASFLGMINSFDMPTRQAFVVEMVGREDLPNAIAINSFVFNSARILGPSIAGLALIYTKPETIFFINGISYVFVIVALLCMKITPRSIGVIQGNIAQRLKEAIKFVSVHAALRDPLLYIGVISLMAFPYNTLMSVITTDVLGREQGAFGMLVSMLGVGALIGAVIFIRGNMSEMLDRVIPFAGCGFGLGLASLSYSRLYWLSALLLIPTGACMMMQTLATNNFIQKLVPDHLRGRVMGFYTMMLLGLLPIGSLLASFLVKEIGILAGLRIGGLCCILGGIIVFIRLARIQASAHSLNTIQREKVS